MTPTRHQKRTWKRRVNRAKHTKNTERYVERVTRYGRYKPEFWDRGVRIVAPWLRGTQ